MAENLYEGMFLLDSGKFAADPDGLSAAIVEMLEKAGATVATHRPWQDGRLAYEIEGRRKGLHYLAYFRVDPAAIKSLTRACKLSDIVIRHLFINQPKSLFDAMVTALIGETAAEEPAATPADEAAPAEEATTTEDSEASSVVAAESPEE